MELRSNRHLSQLDGIRGIAVLMVLFGHVASKSFGLGIPQLGGLPRIGVNLFFVLSGFLITSVLLRAKGEPGYFKNFYARRVLRIFPLYFLLLGILFTASALGVTPLTLVVNGHSLKLWVFALYIQNIYYKTIEALGPITIAVTWSLAIEEQFYMVWPWLISKLTIRGTSITALGIIGLAPLARIFCTRYGYDPYINPLCRIDAMGMGALVSLWIFSKAPSNRQIMRQALFILAASAVLGVVSNRFGWTDILIKTETSAAFTAMLMIALVSLPFAKFLSLAPLRETGKISYCLYLAHPTVALLLAYEMHGTNLTTKLLRSGLIVALSYGVAILSWMFFETPILRFKRFFVTRSEDQPAESKIENPYQATA